jgi:hypothetical protein
MSRRLQMLTCAAVLPLALLGGGLALADYIIDWWTVDGGGEMWTTDPRRGLRAVRHDRPA